nr:unnamed protein product [Callosobruchus chinensis]
MATDRFGESAGNLEDISKHLSLLLTNIDMTLHYPQQLAPNIIPVGGLHMQKAGQLPQDLQIIMDSAKEGVILFSLGTVVRLGYLKHSTMVAILKALGKLDQTVILKSELNLTNVPSNVIVRNWVPQLELLAEAST